MKGLNPFFKSYDLFFQTLREGKYQDFTSTLEADLGGEQGRNERAARDFPDLAN